MYNLAKLMSVKELAARLGIAEITVRKYCCAKKIPYIKLGGRVLFDPEKILAWLEKRSINPLTVVEAEYKRKL